MLIPLNMHAAENDLMQLTELVGAMIEYAKKVKEDAVTYKVKAKYVREDFATQHSKYGWLVGGKKRKVGQVITQMIEFAQADDLEVLQNAFQREAHFHKLAADADDDFPTPGLKYKRSYIIDVLLDFMVKYLYEQIFLGGCTELEDQQISPLDLPAVRREYLAVNGDKKSLCPACLGPLTGWNGHALPELEHYFPKSLYPLLALHPYNLVIICGDCNKAHLDHDTIMIHTSDSLRYLLLPYLRTGLDMMELEFKPRSAYSTVHISGKPAIPDATAWMTNFAQMYRLPDRWHELADIAYKSLVDKVIVEFCTCYGDGATEITEAMIRRVLKRVQKEDAKTQLYEANAYLKGQYAGWTLIYGITGFMTELASHLITEALTVANPQEQGATSDFALANVLLDNAVLLDPTQANTIEQVRAQVSQLQDNAQASQTVKEDDSEQNMERLGTLDVLVAEDDLQHSAE